jgi:hypothetical protein
MVMQSNKTRESFISKGFDSVEIPQHNLANSVDIDEDLDIVYWTPNTVIPISLIKISMNVDCSICLESFPKDIKYGITCHNNHFLCWDNCFSNYLNSSKEVDTIQRNLDQNGCLRCPGCKPDSSGYDLYYLMGQKCPEDIIKAYCDLKESYKLRQEKNITIQEEEAKWKLILKNYMEQEGFNREVSFLKFQIIEEILTPRCPRCKTAFIDFDGCFALTCSNNTCGCGFCAYCFSDCGHDAHGHVAACKFNRNNRDVFGTTERLRKIWNDIRVEKIKKLLIGKQKEVKSELLKGLEKEFSDLKIDRREFND